MMSIVAVIGFLHGVLYAGWPFVRSYWRVLIAFIVGAAAIITLSLVLALDVFWPAAIIVPPSLIMAIWLKEQGRAMRRSRASLTNQVHDGRGEHK